MSFKFNPFTGTLGQVPAFDGEIVTTEVDYEILDDDDAVFCDTIANTIVLTLPEAEENKSVYIKKVNQNNIVSVTGGIIENNSELRILNLGTAVTLVCDGTKWWVV